MQRVSAVLIGMLFFLPAAGQNQPAQNSSPTPATTITGFRDPQVEAQLEKSFIAVPDAKLAGEHLRTLTSAPHMTATPEDRKTAEYVAEKFRAAGFETQIVEYKVWLAAKPDEVSLQIVYPKVARQPLQLHEHVEGDKYQDDPRVVQPFNAGSPSGEAEGDVVYANYGRPEDFRKLQEMKIDVRGKIVITRYGSNYRGVKSHVAEQYGAAAVIIYSDPSDDGYVKGDVYPKGPWRPDSGVQRGSVGYIFKYPGDATTPGFASVPDLPDSKRIAPEKSGDMPTILTMPISYGDAKLILQEVGGPESPRDWQGGLPFTYHVGPGPTRVHMRLKLNYAYRTIWDVIGTIPGKEFPDEMVIGGNHRDAWVYGTVDPSSGTAAMLETVHGMGELLKTGWRPKRTIIFGSWDAEEQGLIGSTEWVEEQEKKLGGAAVYFNMDTAVSGSLFAASAVPSLKQFLRDATKVVPSPSGGSVYDAWLKSKQNPANADAVRTKMPNVPTSDLPVGDLGSGSDFTPFLQHIGVPATDISSNGPYGVYHSTFDDLQWFQTFADPNFLYEQEMARVFGIEVLRMANADVLPHDYETYGKEITAYLEALQRRCGTAFGKQSPDFAASLDAAHRLTNAGHALLAAQSAPPQSADAQKKLNQALISAERQMLAPEGLPKRPWFRHTIYAPGEFTGYAAVVVPSVTEAVDNGDAQGAQTQLNAVTAALVRAAEVLENSQKGD
jgi:N-acetylated-alpha-linked acidic dipeptidase